MLEQTNQNNAANAIPSSPDVVSGASPGLTAGGGFRWTICTLLFFATTIIYIDRQILGLLKSTLETQLHLTNEQFGEVTAIFQLAYAIGMLGFGRIVDRFGTKIGYALTVFAWAVIAICHLFVNTLNSFLFVRFCLGGGESGNFPSAIKSVALWFPKKERALATTLFNSGANVGAMIAPAFVPFLAFHYGWHAPFVLAGCTGLIWLVFWALIYQVPEKSKRLRPSELAYIDSDRDEDHVEGHHPIGLAQLLARPQAWSFIVAKAITDPIWWFFLYWTPDYFNKSRHLDLHAAWYYLFSIYAIVTVLSVIGGWIPGRLISRGWSVTAARKVSLLAFALCVVPMLFTTGMSNWGAVGLLGLAASAHQAWSGNLFSTVADMFPKRAVASLTGLGGMAGSAAGILTSFGAGALLDHYKGNETVAYSITFSIISFAYVLAFVLQHLLAPRFEPLSFPAPAES